MATIEDLKALCEEVNTDEELKIDTLSMGIIKDTLFVKINGHQYGYEVDPSKTKLDLRAIEQIFRDRIADPKEKGKGLAWLKSVTKLASGSVKGLGRLDSRRYQ